MKKAGAGRLNRRRNKNFLIEKNGKKWRINCTKFTEILSSKFGNNFPGIEILKHEILNDSLLVTFQDDELKNQTFDLKKNIHEIIWKKCSIKCAEHWKIKIDDFFSKLEFKNISKALNFSVENFEATGGMKVNPSQVDSSAEKITEQTETKVNDLTTKKANFEISESEKNEQSKEINKKNVDEKKRKYRKGKNKNKDNKRKKIKKSALMSTTTENYSSSVYSTLTTESTVNKIPATSSQANTVCSGFWNFFNLCSESDNKNQTLNKQQDFLRISDGFNKIFNGFSQTGVSNEDKNISKKFENDIDDNFLENSSDKSANNLAEEKCPSTSKCIINELRKNPVTEKLSKTNESLNFLLSQTQTPDDGDFGSNEIPVNLSAEKKIKNSVRNSSLEEQKEKKIQDLNESKEKEKFDNSISSINPRIYDSKKCRDDQHTCDFDKCIDNKYLCDEKNDCNDLSDESSCNYYLSQTKKTKTQEKITEILSIKFQDTLTTIQPECNWTTEFRCTNGDCISFSLVCNDKFDCPDGSDESCPDSKGRKKNNKKKIQIKIINYGNFHYVFFTSVKKKNKKNLSTISLLSKMLRTKKGAVLISWEILFQTCDSQPWNKKKKKKYCQLVNEKKSV